MYVCDRQRALSPEEVALLLRAKDGGGLPTRTAAHLLLQYSDAGRAGAPAAEVARGVQACCSAPRGSTTAHPHPPPQPPQPPHGSTTTGSVATVKVQFKKTIYSQLLQKLRNFIRPRRHGNWGSNEKFSIAILLSIRNLFSIVHMDSHTHSRTHAPRVVTHDQPCSLHRYLVQGQSTARDTVSEKQYDLTRQRWSRDP